jgi:hypothetical protein
VPPSREDIEAAWADVVYDCSCPDLYYCPTSREVECAKHGGFSVCCNRPDEHVTVPHELRKAQPHSSIPPREIDET